MITMCFKMVAIKSTILEHLMKFSKLYSHDCKAQVEALFNNV